MYRAFLNSKVAKLLTTYYSLLATYYLLLTISFLNSKVATLPTTYYSYLLLILTTYYLLLTTYHLPPPSSPPRSPSYLLLTTCYATCYLRLTTYHLLPRLQGRQAGRQRRQANDGARCHHSAQAAHKEPAAQHSWERHSATPAFLGRHGCWL